MKTVIIIGFGKSGQQKMRLYRDLGYQVQAVDPLKIRHSHILKGNSVKYYPSLVDADYKNADLFDICVPTQEHVAVLDQVLKLRPDAKVAIEKPLCSSKKDLDYFISLLGKSPKAKIYYSENYVYSPILTKVMELIKEYKLKIQSVVCEYSKERRIDVRAGRFIDTELGALGIELPHILAMLLVLNLPPERIDKLVLGDLLLNDKILPNQGNILLEYETKDAVLVRVYQSLDGCIHLKDKHFALPAPGPGVTRVYRIMKITCEGGYVIYIQFDPIPGKSRYMARLIVEKSGSVKASYEFEDDNLKKMLSLITDDVAGVSQASQYMQAPFAISIVQLLLKLKLIAGSDQTQNR